MIPQNPSVEDQALDWVIRLQDAQFDDWEAFEAWLAGDAAHGDAYRALAVADQDAAALVSALPVEAAAPLPLPTPLVLAPRHAISRRRWFGAAIAASLVAISSYAVFDGRAAPYVIETPPGMPRTVMFADGSRIDLNGSTRLRLDHNNQRQAALDHGQALFRVVHDDRQPFTVAVGNATVVDVGTVFDIVRDHGVTKVGVAEGSIVYNPGKEAVKLPAGRQLRVADGDSRIALTSAEPADFGAWQEGRLVYAGTPLRDVAADLARNLGVAVAADTRVGSKPFRGVINLGEAGRRDTTAIMSGLAPLLDVRVMRDGAGWRLLAPEP